MPEGFEWHAHGAEMSTMVFLEERQRPDSYLLDRRLGDPQVAQQPSAGVPMGYGGSGTVGKSQQDREHWRADSSRAPAEQASEALIRVTGCETRRPGRPAMWWQRIENPASAEGGDRTVAPKHEAILTPGQQGLLQGEPSQTSVPRQNRSPREHPGHNFRGSQ